MLGYLPTNPPPPLKIDMQWDICGFYQFLLSFISPTDLSLHMSYVLSFLFSNCTVFLRRLALKTVERLTDHLDLSDFASKIIHPIIRLLDSRDTILPAPLCKQAMATLCSLVTQLGKKYRIFIPMVQKILLKQRISDPRYNSLVREIADVS